MKAAVVRAFGEPPVIEERPDPEPGPGRVRVRVEVPGLRRSAIRVVRGDRPVGPSPPVGVETVVGARPENLREVLKGDGVAPTEAALAAEESPFSQVQGGLRRDGRLVLDAMPTHGAMPIPLFGSLLERRPRDPFDCGNPAGVRRGPGTSRGGPDPGDRGSRPLDPVVEPIDEVSVGLIQARTVFEFGEGVRRGKVTAVAPPRLSASLGRTTEPRRWRLAMTLSARPLRTALPPGPRRTRRAPRPTVPPLPARPADVLPDDLLAAVAR